MASVIINEVKAVLNFVSPIWGFFVPHVKYVLELEKNVGLLGKAMKELREKSKVVNRKVAVKEIEGLARIPDVEDWLAMVEATEGEVNEIQVAFDRRTTFLEDCCPGNCWSTYKLGERAVKKLASVVELKNKAVFGEVAEQWLPDSVIEMPSTSAVRMDSMMKDVRSYLGKDGVGVVGIHGMRGVGKTTLLKNINNEFLQISHDFDVVIFVVVSKNPNVRDIQKAIGDKLFIKISKATDQDEAARKILEALRKKKFLVLLDDVWSKLNLEEVGIPQPNRQNQSKLIFTTRDVAVCGTMEADKEICVPCMAWKEAWDLFKDNVGAKALYSHTKIPRFAQIVARKCNGLPLFLITIGKAMASHKTPEEWEKEIQVLSNFSSTFPGMSDKLLLLRSSYDMLASDELRSCFLYCCLYPEDYSIRKDQLIDYWVVEGFLDQYDELDEARKKGHSIIRRLKDAFLLEDGDDPEREVKMHDIIRELALRITSEHKFLVEAGIGLTKVPILYKWTEVRRISLMKNELKELKETHECPNLLTLILQENAKLNKISNSFFTFMPLLKVLDLSNSDVTELPAGICGLVKLQYLNLSCTNIMTLPEELVNLSNLKHLALSGTRRLYTIPDGLIAGLLKLQVLNLHESRCRVDLGEIEGLKELNDVGISIRGSPAINAFLGSKILTKCARCLDIEFWGQFTYLKLSSTFGNMKRLQTLGVTKCANLEDMIIDADGESSLLPSLISLNIILAPKLKTILVSPGCLQNLRFICMTQCHSLKNLTWVLHLQSLQQLSLFACRRVEEIIEGEVEEISQDLPRLKSIQLQLLPKLKSICNHSLSFPSLQTLNVKSCPELKTLPFGPNIANNILREITGEKEWWDGLEWRDESIKSALLPYFKEDSSW